jgi:hypothetical protein
MPLYLWDVGSPTRTVQRTLPENHVEVFIVSQTDRLRPDVTRGDGFPTDVPLQRARWAGGYPFLIEIPGAGRLPEFSDGVEPEQWIDPRCCRTSKKSDQPDVLARPSDVFVRCRAPVTRDRDHELIRTSAFWVATSFDNNRTPEMPLSKSDILESNRLWSWTMEIFCPDVAYQGESVLDALGSLLEQPILDDQGSPERCLGQISDILVRLPSLLPSVVNPDLWGSSLAIWTWS